MLNILYAATNDCIQNCINQGSSPGECVRGCGAGSSSIFGKITAPEALSKFGGVESGAIGKFLNLILNVLVVGAGVYALINLVIAGYSFMSAGDDPKKVAGAWSRIWQTLMGLAFTAGAFVLAAIFGKLIFNDWGAIVNPTIKTLTSP